MILYFFFLDIDQILIRHGPVDVVENGKLRYPSGFQSTEALKGTSLSELVVIFEMNLKTGVNLGSERAIVAS